MLSCIIRDRLRQYVLLQEIDRRKKIDHLACGDVVEFTQIGQQSICDIVLLAAARDAYDKTSKITGTGVVCRVCIRSCACDKQTICIVTNSWPRHLQFDQVNYCRTS